MIDFLCIGAHKSGTSWLNNNLNKHPNIWTPPYKELHFFDELEHGSRIAEERKRKRWLGEYFKNLSNLVENDKRINHNNVQWILNFIQTENSNRTIKWYCDLFSDAKSRHKTTGESTPAYALLSRPTYKKIYDINNDIKIIFILRNPVHRDWSSLRFDLLTDKNLSDKSRIDHLDRDSIYNYLEKKGVENRSNYLKTIRRIESVFPKQNIKYLFFDDIEKNPYGFIEEVCDFLDIEYDTKFFPELSKKKLVSRETDIDIEVLEYLKNKYKNMIFDINKEHVEVPQAWKLFFNL